MMSGSFFGIVTWAAFMNSLVYEYQCDALMAERNQNNSTADEYSLYARWSIIALQSQLVFTLMNSNELLTFGAAKLMLLERLSQFMTSQPEILKRWVSAGRFVIAVFVVCNVIGLGGEIFVAVNVQKQMEYVALASEKYAALASQNVTSDEMDDRLANEIDAALESQDIARSATSIQQFCQVANDVITLIAFTAAGGACSRHVNSMLSSAADSEDKPAVVGREMRRRIVGTSAAVFASSLLRAVLSIMTALSVLLAQFQQPIDITQNAGAQQCRNYCDSSCYGVYTRMHVWMLFAPQFQLTIVAISSPLTMLVALWGMSPRVMTDTDHRAAITAPMLAAGACERDSNFF
jgi:hypothetical protein